MLLLFFFLNITKKSKVKREIESGRKGGNAQMERNEEGE
jgi:hypothetical protein